MSIDGPSDKNICGPDHPQSVGYVKPQTLAFFSAQDPFVLEGGGKLSHVEIEYETYGELSAAKDNAVLICHALTGDAHAAGWDKNPEGPLREYRKNKPGWWDEVIGPGKPIERRSHLLVVLPQGADALQINPQRRGHGGELATIGLFQPGEQVVLVDP